MLGMLLLSGWAAGFNTKMCDHDKTVEAIKKFYNCSLNSLKFGKRTEPNRINGVGSLHDEIKELGVFSPVKAIYQMCSSELKSCLKAEQLRMMTTMTNPMEVVETDNKCNTMQMMGEMRKVQACEKIDGFEEDEIPEITAEICSKIGAGVKKCYLDLKIDCFSKRENAVLAEMIGTAYGDLKDIFAMEKMQTITEELSANEQYALKCALGSGSGKSSLMVGVLFPLVICFHMLLKI